MHDKKDKIISVCFSRVNSQVKCGKYKTLADISRAFLVLTHCMESISTRDEKPDIFL